MSAWPPLFPTVYPRDKLTLCLSSFRLSQPLGLKPHKFRLSGHCADHFASSHASLHFLCNHCDKPHMAETGKFETSKLKKIEMQEKNPLPSEETTDQEQQAGKLQWGIYRQYVLSVNTSIVFLFYFFELFNFVRHQEDPV